MVWNTKEQAVAQGDPPGGAPGGHGGGGTACLHPPSSCNPPSACTPSSSYTPSSAGPCCTQLRPDPARLLSPKITPGLKINKSSEEARERNGASTSRRHR